MPEMDDSDGRGLGTRPLVEPEPAAPPELIFTIGPVMDTPSGPSTTLDGPALMLTCMPPSMTTFMPPLMCTFMPLSSPLLVPILMCRSVPAFSEMPCPASAEMPCASFRL